MAATANKGHFHIPFQMKISERGSSIVETVICMLVLCLILFGLLQLTVLFGGKMIADYAAFRTARSAMVGFNEDIYRKEGRIKAIPASGQIIEPVSVKNVSNIGERMKQEKFAIRDYLRNYNSLQYENWSSSKNSYGTYLDIDESRKGEMTEVELSFRNYPARMPFAGAFFSSRTRELTGNASLSSHSAVYLQE